MVKQNPWVPIIWAIIGIVSIAYLLNIGFGVLEFLPDNLPLIGNVDEVIATLGLLGSFTFYTKINPVKLIVGS